MKNEEPRPAAALSVSGNVKLKGQMRRRGFTVNSHGSTVFLPSLARVTSMAENYRTIFFRHG
jgi:hypothetical protein